MAGKTPAARMRCMDVSTQTVQRPVRFGPAIEARPVVSRLDRRRFLEFSSRIYAADPCWVPPLLLERKQFLDSRKHPFYRHGAAQQFLAWRGIEPVGRILVSDDPVYNAKHNDSVGCFGMFESIEDPEVAHALLDAVSIPIGTIIATIHPPRHLYRMVQKDYAADRKSKRR